MKLRAWHLLGSWNPRGPERLLPAMGQIEGVTHLMHRGPEAHAWTHAAGLVSPAGGCEMKAWLKIAVP